MKISKIKFVILFLVGGFAFQFITNSILGSEVRLFPARGESFIRAESAVPWKQTVSAILVPIKVVLIGPLLPLIDFLRSSDSDPPPPFFVIAFALYWAILALFIRYLIIKINSSHKAQ